MTTLDTKTISWQPLNEAGKTLVRQVAIGDLNSRARRFGLPELRAVEAPSRYRLQSAADLAESRPTRWLVKGVLPESGIAAIYGASGSAKSFLALDLALAVSTGAPWFRARTAQRPVVYVCLEGQGGLAARMAAIRKAMSRIGDVHCITEPFDLLSQRDCADLAAAISSNLADGGLLIIDTLAQACPGVDENSSADMGRAIAALKSLQASLGGLVLILHHSGKDAAKGMRGHSSLIAALDASIEVRRTGDVRQWCLAKSKDGADGISHAFRLRMVDLGTDEDGDRISSCVIEGAMAQTPRTQKSMTPSQRRGMEAFMTAAAKRGMVGGAFEVDAECWRAAFYMASTADSPEAKRKAFSRVRAELVEGGHLVVSNDVYRIPTGSVHFPEIHPDNRTEAGHVPDITRTGQDTTL